MTLVEKIKNLCDERHTNFAALERALGFGGGSIRKWDSATPSGDRLAAVADYFDVSTDFLLGREKKPATISDDELSMKEAEWLKLYHLIPEERRAEYGAMLEAALKSQGLI